MGQKIGMARCLGFGLSRELWLVQLGIFLNMFGYGAVHQRYSRARRN